MNTQAGAQGKAELRTYFPTPVVLLRLANADTLNAELRQTILEREKQTPSLSHSNLGGWQSSWDMPKWGGAATRTLLEAGMDLASKLTMTRIGDAPAPKWRVNAWANVNRAGHGNEFHTHPGAYWSATYYVDDGGIAQDPSLGGEFEFQDPRGVGPAMYAPHLAFNFPAGHSVGASELIRPEAGLMVMFPSWLSHGVRPYRGDRTRISIAFNLSL